MPIPVPSLNFRCKLLEAVDGDTFKGEICIKVTVRLCGQGEIECWAPELHEPGGPEAHAFLQSFEQEDGIIQIPLEEASNLSNLFSFGRLLADWWKDGQDQSVSEQLIKLGLASSHKKGKLGA